MAASKNPSKVGSLASQKNKLDQSRPKGVRLVPPPLIKGLAFDALIADEAFDSNAIIAELEAPARAACHGRKTTPRR